MQDATKLSADALSQMSVLELIALCRDPNNLPARNALIERYFPNSSEVIAALAHSMGLQDSDISDLQQKAFFWLFNPPEKLSLKLTRKGSSAWQRYSRWILRNRIRNYRRDQRRQQLHENHSRPANRILEGGTMEHVAPGRRSLEGLGIPDPAENAEQHEDLERLRQALSKFQPQDRVLLLRWA